MKRAFNSYYVLTAILLILSWSVFNSSFAQLTDASISFDPIVACSGTEISFSCEVIGGTPPYIYAWNFDDPSSPNNTATTADPKHTFNPLGCDNANYTVSLTVTDTSGGGNIQASAAETVSVKRRPNPKLQDDDQPFDPFDNCINNPTPSNPTYTIHVSNITNNLSCITNNSFSIDWGDDSISPNLNSTFVNLEHKYMALGAYDLTISCEGENGCTGTNTYPVQNEANPKMGLNTAGATVGCAPIDLTFSLTFDSIVLNSSATQYFWEFGDGDTEMWSQQTAINLNGVITHTYTETSCTQPNQEFTLMVTAINSCDNTPMTVGGIKVGAPPIALFDTLLGGCVGQGIYIDNMSALGYSTSCSSINTWEWNFNNGGGSSGTFQPDSVFYPSPGVYEVSLTGTSGCGDSTFTFFITIDEPPTAAATASTLSGCVGNNLVVDFANESLGDNLEYLWTVEPDSGYVFVSGTDSVAENPSIHFTKYGVYNVVLKTHNNCDEDFKTFTVFANDAPFAEFFEEEIITCDSPYIHNITPADIDYDDHGENITAYNWSFPGASPAVSNDTFPENIVYANSGDYLISLIIENLCGSDTSQQQIEIVSQVVPSLSADTAVCFNSPAFQLVADPDIGLWSGEIVDENGYVNTNTVGTFYIKYSGECLVADSIKIIIYPLPDVEILSPDIGVCIEDDPVLLGSNPSGGIWQGGGISNPEVGLFDPTLSGSGLFQIFYSYSDTFPDCICTSSDHIFITVDSKPIPDFLPEDTVFCTGIEYTFTNNTQGGNSNEMFWEFPDGSTSTAPDEVDYLFNNTGIYFIKITAQSLYGCIDSTIRQVEVIEPPPNPYFTLGFSPSNLCSPVDVTITFDPTVYDQFNSFAWDFGNGTSLSSKYSFNDTTITYYQGIVDSSYFISLDVINQCGVLNYTGSITVHAPPVAKFGQDYNWNCSPKPVHFINKSLGLADSMCWDFGDGNDTVLYHPQMDQILTHSFYTDGNDTLYNISMITYNPCGTDTILDSVIVFPNTLTAFFNTDTTFGCSPLTVNFTNYSSPHTLNYTWAVINHPDTLKYINEHFVYTFQNNTATTDTFLVQLWIDDNCSRDSAVTEVIVYPKPDLNFQMSSQEICAGEAITFENLSNVADMYWDFDDGTILFPMTDIVSHVFDTSGQFQVSLIGRSVDFGCWDSILKPLTVKPTPKAFIQTSETAGCAPFSVYFESDSSFNQIWDFGDQSQFSIEPYHTYTKPGLYMVTMISEFENYCADTAQIEIRVLPKPTTDFNLNSLGGYPEKIQLINTSIDYLSCEWILPDMQSVFECGDIEYEFDNIGNYSITLVTMNEYDCPDTITKIHEVYFKGLYLPDAFSPDNPNETLREFKAVGIGLQTYQLEVYDTYGNMIWNTNLIIDSKPAEGWDGSYKGSPLQQDVYIWKADATFIDNTIWQGMDDGNGKLKKYGTVTLIR